MGYVAKVNEPTHWVNSIIVTEKSNDDIRMCIDPKDLNMSVRGEHFHIPTKEEILSDLTEEVHKLTVQCKQTHC